MRAGFTAAAPRRAQLCSLALLVLFATLRDAAALAVNGGAGCKFYDYREVNQMLRDQGWTDAGKINDVIERMKYVDFVLCKRCKSSQGTEMHEFGVVDPKRGECWCQAGFGYWSETKPNGRVEQNYGCSRCPAPKTTSPTKGPYDPAKHRWSATQCA
jgi:hypothetical protein